MHAAVILQYKTEFRQRLPSVDGQGLASTRAYAVSGGYLCVFFRGSGGRCCVAVLCLVYSSTEIDARPTIAPKSTAFFHLCEDLGFDMDK